MLTDTINSLALKLGQSFGLSGAGKAAGIGAGSKALGLILLVLALPIGMVLLGVSLVERNIASLGRNARRWIVTKTVLTLLVLASVMLLGFAGWTAYDYLQERRISIAAGSRTEESYQLAQALKAVAERHYPHIKMAILEIEGAAGETGILENGLVQMAIAPADFPAGPSARSVAVLAGPSPRVLLARDDVDERVVYALTQMLTQFGAELTTAIPVGKAAPQPHAVSIQKPGVQAKSDAPLHPGAAAFYDWDKTPFVLRYAKLSALVSAGLVLLGLWIWQLRHRARRRQVIQTMSFSPPAEREPWTFSKILLESAGETSAPGGQAIIESAPGRGATGWLRWPWKERRHAG
ncbi:MAG: hypothetical protein ACREEM_48315 [Blastocatellia bacterium]